MKRSYFIIMLLFTNACMPDFCYIKESDLKFKAGQKVSLKGFYSLCEGYILDHALALQQDNSLNYLVEIKCGSREKSTKQWINDKDIT